MNKLFIVPSNIFTFSFGNHRPAQAVIFILFPNITIFPINKTAYTHKNSAHHYFLMTSRVLSMPLFNLYTGNDNYKNSNIGTAVP